MTELESKFFEAMSNINDKLSDIEKNISAIETKLENDFREIHGNGQPGLVQKVADLEKEVAMMKKEDKTKNDLLLWILNGVAWFVTTGLAVFGIFHG